MEFLLIFLGYILGINFPDIDHKIKFLGHRSFLTHSPIPTLILYFLGEKSGLSDFNFILIGFSFAVGIHLVFDLFPKKWTGGSIIKPFGGILFSKVYIFLGSFLSFLFSLRIAKDIESYLFMSSLGIFALYIYSKKERTIFRPVILYTSTILILGNFYFKNFNIEVSDFLGKVVNLLRF